MAEIADLFVRLRAETAPFAAGMRRASEEGEALTSRMGGATAMLRKLGAATTLVGIGFVAYGVKAAGDFQQQMNLLVTACGESSKNLKMVSNGVMALARETGTSTGQLAEGMYQVEKAGYRAGDGLKVLRAAAQGAREEGADLKDVTNAMTSVMASYHLKATDSVRVMNALKTAAGEGKMTMQEFSASLATVIPIASANKVSFGEVGGAIATLSQHGTSAREATQELASTIRNLAAPNNVAVQEMQRLGLSSVDVSTKLGKRGLTGTLDLLSETVLSKMGSSGTLLLSSFNKTKQAAHDADVMIKSMPQSVQGLAKSYSSMSKSDWTKALKGIPNSQRNLLTQYATLINKSNGFSAELKRGGPAAQTYTEAIKKMTGGAIGLNTTLQLTGENTEGFKDRVDKVSKSFNHASKDVEGWALTQKSFNVQMGRLKEAVTTAAITVGAKLIPVILKVVTYFEKHKAAAIALAAVIAGVLTAAVISFAAGAVVGAVKGVSDITKGLIAAAKAVKAFALSERVAAVASKIWAAGQAMVNAVMSANPIILIVIAVVALVAALIYAYKHSERFRAIVQAAFAGVKTAALAVWHALGAVWNGIVAGVTWLWHALVGIWNRISSATSTVWNAIAGFFKKWWPLLIVVFAFPIAVLISIWNHFHTQITAVAQAVWNGILAFLRGTWNAIKAVASVAWAVIKAVIVAPMVGLWHFLQSIWHTISGWLRSAWGAIRGVASSLWGSIKSAMTGPVKAAWSVISSTMGLVKSVIGSKLTAAWNAAKDWGSKFLWVGKDIVMGIVNGVKNAGGALFDSLKSLANGALKSAKSFLGINSPSKLFAAEVGTHISTGIAQGVTESSAQARAAVHGVAKGMIDQASKTLGIASPSKVFRQLGIYVNEGLIDGLTSSMARVKAATRRIESLLIQAYNKVADLKGTKGVSNKWVKSHEATIKRLEAYVGKEDRLLRSLAAKRDSVASKLKSAQSRLASLQKAWSDQVKSVADGVMQGFSIVTDAPQEGFALTAQDVVNKMRDQMAKAMQFAAQLQALKKKGLSSDLIAQIAAAGVDQGGATAAALGSASKSQIQQINAANKATKAAATSAGKAVADSMYGSGIRAAQGLVKGLQSQEKAIEKQMLRIAKAMQKAIKRALGIKSPSTVFAGIGQWIPRGLAAGVEGGAHHATRAMNRLASSVAGTGFGGSGLALAGGGGGGGSVNHYHFTFNVEGSVATVDKLSKEVEASFLRRGMRNPLTYQQYKR
ncbi:tail tape measure protein, TIGR01760 family [Streptomyces turgidiscabies Car8]|uniref:Tail tape measure protein, TIGR01760 family n=1 Tax=Streptomyces turgidiscabies (strain Car8) TaxID=698760 RepID=L7F7W2_STRT8|nr:phage tail tape measure protein [Streptomyces turgidiscabies]ELP67683.1 tail tape measure protein, TIGR01760 family [Streptomyces turgidiscabies Car8]